MSNTELVCVECHGDILHIGLQRPQVRNAVNRATAEALTQAFRTFEADDGLKVAVMHGIGANFCAGADLKAVAGGSNTEMNRLSPDGDGPMGPTRMMLSKPVIAAISGYCVAGGLELALWCDLRVADDTARFGVFCRRFGVPLIDGGTVRLPRLIGQSRALDMILTGREVGIEEAHAWGLVNRRVANGEALSAAHQLARRLADFPQQCLRNDRRSVLEQWGLDEQAALGHEFEHGLRTLQSGESGEGARRFTGGIGRHAQF